MKTCDEAMEYIDGPGNKKSPLYNRMYKVEEYTDLCIKNWNEVWEPSLEVAMDEMMVKHKGRFPWRQYVRGNISKQH